MQVALSNTRSIVMRLKNFCSSSVDLLESTAHLILGTTLVCSKYDTTDCIPTGKSVLVSSPIAKLLLQGLKGSLL